MDRALVVGMGSIGRRHLRLLRTLLPKADIRVLRHAQIDEGIAEANGFFFNQEQALSFEPQLAIVANPSPFHLPISIALAEQGTHLLVEKPLSNTSASVDHLIELCKRNGCILQTAYNLRFLSSIRKFRELLQQDTIGQIYTIRSEVGQYLPSWRKGSDYRQGVTARAELGGGVLLELSHDLDLLHWLFGRVAWVSAWIGKQSALDIDVEDSAQLSLGFTSGYIAQVGLDFIRHDTVRTCTVIGERASLRWDAIEGSVSLLRKNETVWTQVFFDKPPADASYLAQIEHFLTACQTPSTFDKARVASGLDGRAVLDLIEAARTSASLHCAQVNIENKSN